MMNDEALLQELDYLVAQNLHEQLLDEVSTAKKSAPRNFSKFSPAQTLLQKLKDDKYADAIRMLSQNSDDDEDPVEKMIRRLSQVKNPTRQGKGIKKTKHIRPRARKTREPFQLVLKVGVPGRHRKQNKKNKVKTKNRTPNSVTTQLTLF